MVDYTYSDSDWRQLIMIGITFMTIAVLDDLLFEMRQLRREAREAADRFVEMFERKDSQNSHLYSRVL